MVGRSNVAINVEYRCVSVLPGRRLGSEFVFGGNPYFLVFPNELHWYFPELTSTILSFLFEANERGSTATSSKRRWLISKPFAFTQQSTFRLERCHRTFYPPHLHISRPFYPSKEELMKRFVAPHSGIMLARCFSPPYSSIPRFRRSQCPPHGREKGVNFAERERE